jgi:hypothetical protein
VISVLVRAEDAERGLKALHRAFDLGGSGIANSE